MINTSNIVTNGTRVNINPDSWLVDSENINKFLFGNNYEYAKQFLRDANALIAPERLYLTKDRFCETCCCICAATMCIGIPCFMYWLCQISKEGSENHQRLKEKLKTHINNHRDKFNENGVDVNFHEDKIYIPQGRRTYEKVVYSFDFVFSQNIGIQVQGNQQQSNQNQNFGGLNSNQIQSHNNYNYDENFNQRNDNQSENVQFNPNFGSQKNQTNYQVSSNQINNTGNYNGVNNYN
jgi:hypothetical protein